MRLESLAYSFFGNNLVIGPHIRKQLAFLRETVPRHLQHREMDDLGCGDGKVTVLLEEIFQPVKLRGFDINPGLVRRARSRGIDAMVSDLDGDMPDGELAVMWGVLHHLQAAEVCLQRLKKSYPLIFIREPVRTGLFKGLELGHPLELRELICLINRHLPDSQIHCCDSSILIFYTCPDYVEQVKAFSISDDTWLLPELSVVVGKEVDTRCSTLFWAF
jgi:SAM-dependent methyltransferase